MIGEGIMFICFQLTKDKNKFNKNEDIEIITPSEKFITQVTEIRNDKGEDLELANTNNTVDSNAGITIGSVILLKILNLEAFKIVAASSKLASIFLKIPPIKI